MDCAVLAARHEHKAVVQLLLGEGSLVEAQDRYGWTALHWAAREGQVTVVQLLLQMGADTEAEDTDGWTALQWAACYGQGQRSLIQVGN